MTNISLSQLKKLNTFLKVKIMDLILNYYNLLYKDIKNYSIQIIKQYQHHLTDYYEMSRTKREFMDIPPKIYFYKSYVNELMLYRKYEIIVFIKSIFNKYANSFHIGFMHEEYLKYKSKDCKIWKDEKSQNIGKIPVRYTRFYKLV